MTRIEQYAKEYLMLKADLESVIPLASLPCVEILESILDPLLKLSLLYDLLLFIIVI